VRAGVDAARSVQLASERFPSTWGRCPIRQRQQDGEGQRRVARHVRAAVVGAGVVLVLLLTAPTAQAVPSVTYKCTPAPADCSGWFRSDVAIKWTVIPSDATVVAGCQPTTLSTDTTGTNVFCSVDDGSATVTVQLKIKVDRTPPAVTGGSPARAADSNGWYDHAVGIVFSGADLTSGIDSCTSTTYDGPDSAAASLSGTCTDKAGNVSPAFAYGLKYDATAPTLTGVSSDHAATADHWFNRPVTFAATAVDAMSGLADCPPVTYAGPDSATGSVTAVCRDQAGNVASRAVAVKYDTTPPAVSELSAAVGDRSVTLHWQAEGGAVQISRTPGVGGAAQSVVFDGLAARFIDTKVANRDRYTYAITAGDAAGNVTTRTVVAVPRPHLISPGNRAVLRAGRAVVLRWTPVRRANYYNLQLFRNGRKVLSAWPARPSYRLRGRWTHAGRHFRLAPGRYRWLVWPGHGARAKSDYGQRIGRRTFTVAGR
jgi:hypothetical protein